MEYFLLSVITLLISTISGDVEISFMKAVPRLNDLMYCDYYFACHAEGETLQWIVNNNNISDYSGQSVGHVFTGSISTCNYTTTLLLLKPMPPGLSIFDSLLIVSCQGSIGFDVNCTNGLVSSMTHTSEKGLTTRAGNNIPSVKLEHVLNANLVAADNSSCTNIFVCGVDNNFITWQIQENSFLFSNFDNIGMVRQFLQDTTTAEQQAILIGKEVSRLVVVMIVIGSAEINVTCGYPQNNANIGTISCPTNLGTTLSKTTVSGTTVLETTVSETTVSETSTDDVSSTIAIEVDNVSLIAGLSAFFGILLVLAVVIVIIVLCCLRHVPKSTNLQEQEQYGHKQYMSIRQESGKWLLDEEYEKLENEPASTSSSDIAKSNDDKNRFPNFYPYDEYRVILHSAKGSDYINATRIENQEIGQQKQKAEQPKTYFATQEPLPTTVDDFWRMIYEYNVTTIVVLTSIIERGKNEHYWQEQARMVTIMKGTDLKITVKNTTSYADYEIRNIEIECKSEKREVRHYQFLGWPPKEVPIFATSFIQFVRRVMHDFCFQRNTSAPLVVQSSSGIGRSGAFITVCAMINKIEEKKDQPFSIYDFVRDLRSRSRFMVSSVTQYKFIYDVLEEMRKDGSTSLTIPLLRRKVNEYSSQIAKQFELLNEVSRIPDVKQQSEAQKYYNIEKNRSQNRVPYDDSRVQLRRTNRTGSDYINASFVNGYKQPTRYIATQTPLKDTKSDFWRMIWEYGCQTIVSLWQQQNEQQEIQKFWPENGKYEDYDKLEVKIESEELFQNYRQLKISITKRETSQKLPVTLCQYDGWPESSKPSTTADIWYLISSLKHSSSKYIAVMCSDGADRTGAFITIHAMIERFETEGIVDIFQFIKCSRINRAHLVTNLENFKFCHEVLAEYLEQHMNQHETSL